MKPDYASLFETLQLGEPDEAELTSTMRLSFSDNDTLRTELPLLPVGTSRDSQFQLSEILGQGGMGVVHLAHQPALGRDVAIKTLLPGVTSREPQQALLNEARAMGIVEHPSVVPVHSIGQDDSGRPVIVMKRIAGTTWDLLLDGKEEPDSDDPLGFHLSVVIAICRAVEFAHHRGIIHRDIKPENVMIGQFGEIYLLDWGLAGSTDPDQALLPYIGKANGVVGTPAYMAPEMTVGDGKLMGSHTDVFLLGAVLYHAVAGTPPNRGTSLFDVLACSYEGRPRSYPEATPTELCDICERAMALESRHRYASATELREALEAFATHRNSYELTDTANERLRALRAHARSAGDERLDSQAEIDDDVHQIFGEARFGFISALQIWKENEAARRGLHDSLVVMIEHELSRENVASAETLYGQLPYPAPEVRTRIDERAGELRAREERLEKLAYDYDENVGIHAKRWVVGVMAATFATPPFILPMIEDLTVPAPLAWLSTDPVLIGANLFGIAFAPVFLVFLLYTRLNLQDHKTSRIFARGMTLMYLLGYGARTTTLWGDNPLHIGAAWEISIFACGLMMLGMSIDRRLFAAGLCYAAGIIPTVLWPGFVIEIYSIASVSACLAFLSYDRAARAFPWLSRDV